jgi:hypothetical protein
MRKINYSVITSPCQNSFQLFVVATLISFFLVSCGGGGGGSSNNGNNIDNSLYVGNTSPAVITAANAVRLTGDVFGIESLDSQLPVSAVSEKPQTNKTTSESLLQVTHMIANIFTLDNLGGAATDNPPSATQKIFEIKSKNLVQPATTIDESDQCAFSGFTKVSGDLDDTSGTGMITLTFNSCNDGSTTINGPVTWRIDDADQSTGTWIPLDSTFTFNEITMVSTDSSILLDGTLRMQFNSDGSETLTFNIVTKDNNTQRMQKVENFVDHLSYSFTSYYLSETITGRFYDSIDGYLDVSTSQTLYFAAPNSLYPSGGQLLLTGSNNSRLRLTASPDDVVLIELDAGNDTVYEVSGKIPWEVIAASGSNPNDADGDGIPNSWETAHELSDASYADASLDQDADTLTNYEEYLSGTDPLDSDSDSDGMPDGWEVENGLDPASGSDAGSDADGDTLSNYTEFTLGTNPLSRDTDSDGMLDDWEVKYGLNPVSGNDAISDPDGDTLSNNAEYSLGTNPLNSDTDSDGMPDNWEVEYGLNPVSDHDASLDLDGDGASNLLEYSYDTDPSDSDSFPLEIFPHISLGHAIHAYEIDYNSNKLYAVDKTNKTLSIINLTTNEVESSHALLYVPSRLCIDASSDRLYLTNINSSFISEFKLSDMTKVADIPWTNSDWGSDIAHFHIKCDADFLYVTDANWAPSLHKISRTTPYTETVLPVDSVGDFYLAKDGGIYTWFQYGWSAGMANSSIRRYDNATGGYALIDETTVGYPMYQRDPLDSPIFIDETRNLAINKHFIFNSLNLKQTVYSFDADALFYAADLNKGYIATKDSVYSLDTYSPVTSLSLKDRDGLFFDNQDDLYILDNSRSMIFYLSAQDIN